MNTNVRRIIGALLGSVVVAAGGVGIWQAVQSPPAPIAAVTPASTNFGSVNTGGATGSTVLITNPGTAPLTYMTALTGANPSQFAVTSDTCAGTVPPGGSCTVDVSFAPSQTGTLSATLRITDNAAGSPHTTALAGTGTSSGSGLVANVWLAPTGSDGNAGCVAHGTAIADPGASQDCATPQQACSLLPAGGIVGMAAGQYNVGFVLSSCNPSATVTFENVPGGFVDFAPAGNISNTSNVTLQGDQAGHGVGLSLGYMGVNTNVTNLAWNTINVYCQASAPWNVITSSLSSETACSASVYISGSVNGFTWNGGDESDWATCLTSCTHTETQSPVHNTIDPGPTNITVESTTISHYFDLDNNGSSGDHSEAWMIRGGNYVSFIDNKFTDCSPPPATGYAVNNSCNSSYVFLGQSGTQDTANNVTFTQNVIAPGGYACTGCTGQKALSWSYDVIGGVAGAEYHATFLYNDLDGGVTICGAGTNNKCGPGSGTTITGSNIVMAGNIGILGATGTCFSAATYSHNVWFFQTGNAAHCSSTDTTLNSTSQTVIWTSPRSPNFDYSLLASTSPALNAGENVYCPAADVNGKARPTSTPCDAGAIQH